ncbi:MAG: hypothetical protein U1C97_01155, partial [Candidatus Gracilibacteria bacterium]|nr:hypothetical protein [Candidatus Gracilibacteria bacterium]
MNLMSDTIPEFMCGPDSIIITKNSPGLLHFLSHCTGIPSLFQSMIQELVSLENRLVGILGSK